MTPLFTPDFSSVDATIPIYEKGRYRLKTTKRTPVVREKNENGVVTQSSGVRYGLEMVGMFDERGELITKDLQGRTVSPFTVWVHTPGGWKFSKGFIMACAGYNVRNEEELANKELFQANPTDWIVNGEVDAAPENIEVGAGYDKLVDKLVDVTLHKKVDKTDDGREFDNQEFGSWAPVV